MLTGSELVELVRDTRVRRIEEHISSLYEMRFSEVSAWIEPILAGLLAIVIAIVGAIATASSPRDMLSSAAVGSVLIVFASCLSLFRLHRYLRRIRVQCTAAKHLS